MKERKCPNKEEHCWYCGLCENCEWHLLIQKYEKKIARLNKKIADLQAPPNYPPVLAYKFKLEAVPFLRKHGHARSRRKRLGYDLPRVWRKRGLFPRKGRPQRSGLRGRMEQEGGR